MQVLSCLVGVDGPPLVCNRPGRQVERVGWIMAMALKEAMAAVLLINKFINKVAQTRKDGNDKI